MKKYDQDYENVPIESQKVEILEEILEYSEYHPKFDPSFAISVKKNMWKEGYISYSQYQGLLNIYYGFQMDKPYEKNESKKLMVKE